MLQSANVQKNANALEDMTQQQQQQKNLSKLHYEENLSINQLKDKDKYQY